jgi:3-oxoacyl-[acyl-carrier protein] reductase
MNIQLSGKTALVCGSSQGIGKATALELANAGATIVLLARNPESLENVKNELSTISDAKHTYYVADFNDNQQVIQIAQTIVQHHHIHILINNTGGPPAGPAYSADAMDFAKAFQNHLINNHILTQAVLPYMKSVQFGRIINVISTSVKQPLPNLGVSNTVRGAVANWAKSLANEVASFGITVNNVLPGATEMGRLSQIIQNKAIKMQTEMHLISEKMISEIPAARFATPQEIAYAITFLSSEQAAYINGINLPVDGGRTACL